MHISTMLVFWSLASLVRNSVVLAAYLLFSVACFFTVHEHCPGFFHTNPIGTDFQPFSLTAFHFNNIVVIVQSPVWQGHFFYAIAHIFCYPYLIAFIVIYGQVAVILRQQHFKLECSLRNNAVIRNFTYSQLPENSSN